MEPKINENLHRFLEDSDSNDSIKSCENNAIPMNLKQIRIEHKISDNAHLSNESTISKCVKTKAFSIKDILGLDDKDKQNLSNSSGETASKKTSESM